MKLQPLLYKFLYYANINLMTLGFKAHPLFYSKVCKRSCGGRFSCTILCFRFVFLKNPVEHNAIDK